MVYNSSETKIDMLKHKKKEDATSGKEEAKTKPQAANAERQKNKDKKKKEIDPKTSAKEQHKEKNSEEDLKGKDKSKRRGSKKGLAEERRIEKQDEEENEDNLEEKDKVGKKRKKSESEDSDEVEKESSANKTISKLEADRDHMATHEKIAKKGKNKSDAVEKIDKKDHKTKEEMPKTEDKDQTKTSKNHEEIKGTSKLKEKDNEHSKELSQEDDNDSISLSSSSDDNSELKGSSINFRKVSIKSLKEYDDDDKVFTDIRYVRWINGGTEYARAIIAAQFAFLEALQRKEKDKFIDKLKSSFSELFQASKKDLNDFFSQLDKNTPYELVKCNKAAKNSIGNLLLSTVLLSKKTNDKKNMTEGDWEKIAENLTINIEVHNKITKKNRIYNSSTKPILNQPLKLLVSKKYIGILYKPKQAFNTKEITEDNIREPNGKLIDLKGNPIYENYIDFIINTSNKLLKTFKEDIDEISRNRELLNEATGDLYKETENNSHKKIKELGNKLRQYQSKYKDYCRFLYTFYYSE